MTSDCYAILGVTPTAEDVVIGAAYRALMRHYHPDTNSDPKAQARAQEVSAAYAILRDPAKRAEYDSTRGAGGILWPVEDQPEPPPPMRTAGLATALLAVVLVGAVWAWPRPPDPPRTDLARAERPAAPRPAPPVAPPVRPEPQSESLAAPAVGPPLPAPEPIEAVPDIEPVAAPPQPIQMARAEPVRAVPRLAPRPALVRKAPLPAAAKPEATAADPKPAADNDRVATLNRMSDSFLSQSIVHATDAKKQQLLAARDRSAALRKACRSDSCVADAYVREIRETSAIMEGRAGPK